MHFPFVVYWKDMCIALFTHADKVLLSGVSSIRWCANSTPLVFWVQMAYHLVVSSLSFSSLMLYSGHKIKEKKSWALLSFPSLVLINTVNLQESAWRKTLPPTNHFWFGPFRLTHHILQGQNPFPHSLYPRPSWYTGGIRSLLRNNWHSKREYTAGICPWFPRLTRGDTAEAWQGDMSLACLVPNLAPFSLHTDEWRFGNVGEWTSAQVCTTSLTLLMISKLDFPFEETLTCVISRQICKESQVSTN